MFERQERTAFLLLLGIALIVTAAYLAFDVTGKSAFAVPFDKSSPDGQLVAFEGTVNRVAATATGGNLILVCDDVTIFITSRVAEKIDIQKGDHVALYGIVQTYKGKKELTITSERDIFINP